MELIQRISVRGFSTTVMTIKKLVDNRLGAYLLEVSHRELLSGCDVAGCEDRLGQRGCVESVFRVRAAGVVQPRN